jgi:hypothetical protein
MRCFHNLLITTEFGLYTLNPFNLFIFRRNFTGHFARFARHWPAFFRWQTFFSTRFAAFGSRRWRHLARFTRPASARPARWRFFVWSECR